MEKNKTLKVAGDLIYTVAASVLLNIILQVIIYPLINRLYGESVTGDILYFVGIIYIVPQALGTAIGNVRLMLRKNCDITNQDFIPYAVVLSAITAVVCGFVAFWDSENFIFPIAFGLFSILYFLRMYLSVEFRLTLKFKGYFLYFLAISIGYLIGFGLYLLTDLWLLIFTVGEAVALIYSFVWGKMFRKDGLSGNRKKITKELFMVGLSIIVRDCVSQFDKIILKQTLGSGMVTHYHVISLISKTIMMLVQPINTLILSYLTVKDSTLSKKQLAKFTFITLGFGAIFYLGCIIATPIFIRWFYPDLYDSVMPYNLIVNLGIILSFISTMFMAILLTQGKTLTQLLIQCVWGITYIVAAYFAVTKYELWGLAYVTLITNIIKIVAIIVFMFKDKKVKKV